MSMRFRLIGLVCFVLLVSLGLGSAIAYSTARRSVRHEMGAALGVGRQTVETAIVRLQQADDPRHDLDGLVASFEGNRHLRVHLNGEASITAAPTIERSVFGHVPGWFVGLIGVSPRAERIAVAIGTRNYGIISIETDPYNEIVEVWNEFTDSLITPAVFCGLTILLIYAFIGRILEPLDRLARALEDVGGGRYRTRISGRLPPELAGLCDSFNRMAAQLGQSDAENRLLNEQLLTLQEQERADLARDLHDEVTPFLFAINVDTATASRLITQHRPTEALDNILSIAEASRQAQQRVRRILGRLRPIAFEELELSEAIENIVGFWRRRRREVRFLVRIAAECEKLPELTGMTVCRIVQEALSNAVRHADPQVIAIAIDRSCGGRHNGGEIVVEIADDGRGIEELNRAGYGLIGISERVKIMGGRLTLSNREGGGFVVSAALPWPPTTDRRLSPVAEAEL
jgi:two-component system, NarL family, sensor histidine kinase UhpB